MIQPLIRIIELDGYTHDFEEVYDKDMIKEQELKKIGINILRFDDREVMNDIDNVLRVIEFYILKHEEEQPCKSIAFGFFKGEVLIYRLNIFANVERKNRANIENF
ncbi:MAG: DUF559 domain-containing protein [Bacteroidota bacterium]|nr:DUF559 domain-containing protein [Bacteroidota bacterium]